MQEHRHIVQYSGGMGSFSAAERVVAEYGVKATTLLFSDTKAEHEDTYRFLHESAAYIGCKVTVIADGRDIWQVFRDKRFLGNSRVDPCSRILKRELCKTWVEKHFTPDQCTLYVGIDWMEAHRMKNVLNWWQPYTVVAPLVGDHTYDKNRAIEKLHKAGVKRQVLYELNMPHANCSGGCVKAGKAHFLLLLDKLPEVYEKWETEEEKLRQYLQKDVTILKEQVKNETKYLTLRVLRERAEEHRATESGQLDFGGCGCFNDFHDDEL